MRASALARRALALRQFACSSCAHHSLPPPTPPRALHPHAGAGTILETLRAGKPLIVVTNDALMDNHQLEVAGALADAGHLLCATPSTLMEVFRSVQFDALVPFPPARLAPFRALVDGEMGVR